jgi:Uma2 family endonuclease
MSVASAWPDHLISLQEWDDLKPEELRRCELVEGVLVVVPKPARMHQRSMVNLGAALDRQLPTDLAAIADTEVLLGSGDLPTVRAPDLVIVTNEIAESPVVRLSAGDVLVAIEIVSPGSGRTDRVTKKAEYAEAGIGHYWIIELGPPVTLSSFVQDAIGAPYVAGVSGSGILDLSAPVGLRLDLDGLTRR